MSEIQVISDLSVGNPMNHEALKKNMRNLPFWQYFNWWIKGYKEGHIQPVTLNKYYMTGKHIQRIAPEMLLRDLDRNRLSLQWLLNEFGKSHRHQTTLDFKTHVIASLHSAVDDCFITGISQQKIAIRTMEDGWSIEKRNAVKRAAKTMTESEYRLFKTHTDIDLRDMLKQAPIIRKSRFSTDNKFGLNKQMSLQTRMMAIAFLLHTGARFAEAFGFTGKDIHQDTITIDKTWAYKNGGGFAPTKNEASIRDVIVDESLADDLALYVSWKQKYFGIVDLPILVEPEAPIYNDTFNHYFKSLLKKYGVKETNLTIHKIRHTYISYLLNESVSPESIARQVGHTDTSMIQKVYGHLMKERAEVDKIRIMSVLR
ncbi:site-specific integrase [Lactobacillus plantarum]|uniref:site-specific integrase n=1 Tax=Lactiplantibacillus plantarum TaxID=1590 RepID=UPI00143E0BC2|nr:site-specific integrase [Lactiplantibacillus plantarum]MBE1727414.1 site-specific integrase [Lactiplantibacillus plantarum]NKI39437.1 site-specific integrase [Lactiplantibacillus plantarum]